MWFSGIKACFLFCFVLFLPACAFQRASDARLAQQKMVGMSKDDVFSCMGIPYKKATEGETTIWLYKSTNGYSYKQKRGSSYRDTSFKTTLGFQDEVKKKRFCTVQIVMQHDHVKFVRYNGPTGGFLTEDEQCSYAIRNCL